MYTSPYGFAKGHFSLSQGVFGMLILAICTSTFAAAVVLDRVYRA